MGNQWGHVWTRPLNQQKRNKLAEKCRGVFRHEVIDRSHPLVNDINTHFDVPHSRYNEIPQQQFEEAGLRVLVASPDAGTHLAVSEDLFRIVYFQGHPEYGINNLLKKYKREILLFIDDKRDSYPPLPPTTISASRYKPFCLSTGPG